MADRTVVDRTAADRDVRQAEWPEYVVAGARTAVATGTEQVAGAVKGEESRPW